MKSNRFRPLRRGFTLIELLVVIGIIVLLLGLLLPAIQRVRESANLVNCSNHLKNIGQGIVNSLSDRNNIFPTGGGDLMYGGGPMPRSGPLSSPAPTASGVPASRENQDWGWGYQILPYIDRNPVWNSPNDADVVNVRIPTFFCPSRRAPQSINNSVGTFGVASFGIRAVSDYAGNAGCFPYWDVNGTANGNENLLPVNPPYRNGIFVKNRNWTGPGAFQPLDQPLRPSDVSDGAAYTIMISEKRMNSLLIATGTDLGVPQVGDRFGFTSGFSNDMLRTGFLPPIGDYPRGMLPSELPGNQAQIIADGFGAAHTMSMNALFADGSVRRIRFSLNDAVEVRPVGTPPIGALGSAVNLTVFQRLCHRSDGGKISADDFE